jgi:UDP-N-acetyl-D-galactosamine dehydrogenase
MSYQNIQFTEYRYPGCLRLGTKWNFLPFKPGLVGGHCIGVDPLLFAQKAQEMGYHPEIILAGRRLNDSMGNMSLPRCEIMIKRDFSE